MNVKAARPLFIYLTFGISAVLSLVTFLSLLSEDQEEMSQTLSRIVVSQTRRSPASEVSANEVIDKKSDPSALEVRVNIFCGKEETSMFEVSGESVHLLGKFCGADRNSAEVEIVNKTNGFTAAFFRLDQVKFQTDLIPLELGKNEIWIQTKLNKAVQTEKILSVVRTTSRSPSQE